MQAAQIKAVGGCFWRHSPRVDGGQAAANPHTNALYIPDVTPLIGGNYLDAFTGPPVVQTEWFMHEFAHLSLSLMPIGVLLRKMAYGIYLILHSLNPDLLMYVPSWRLTSHPDLTRLMPRLVSLHTAINNQAAIVEEAICTSMTIANYVFFRRTNKVSSQAFEDAINDIKNNTDPQVWRMCKDLTPRRWLAKAGIDAESLIAIHLMLLGVGQYALSASDETLQGWWQSGRVPEGEGPLSRLEFATGVLQDLQKRILGWEGLTAALKHAGILHVPTTSDLRKLLEQETNVAQRAPEPLRETAAALGFKADGIHVAHPVGRAINFLLTGYVPRSEEPSHLLDYKWQLSPFGDWAVVIPLATEIAHSPGDIQCRHMVRLPLGRMISRVMGQREELQEVWQRALRGESVNLGLGALTIMPVREEVTLLWDLDRMTRDLVTSSRLECLCAPGHCNGASGCHCSTTLADAYEHIRTDAGDRLPPISCLHS